MPIFHVLSRGVDKRKIFLDDKDHFRFIHNLFELNDKNAVNHSLRRLHGKHREENKRELLVDIYAFCLMPNHYHLLISPRTEKAMPKFMKKLNMAYAKYFNIKYERRGTLFESRYKSVSVTNEAHFSHLPYYIHLNPLDLIAPEWRQKRLENLERAVEFLGSYRWSSYLDYIGKRNFPSVTNRTFLQEVFGGESEQKNNVINWLKELNFESLQEKTLE